MRAVTAYPTAGDNPGSRQRIDASAKPSLRRRTSNGSMALAIDAPSSARSESSDTGPTGPPQADLKGLLFTRSVGRPFQGRCDGLEGNGRRTAKGLRGEIEDRMKHDVGDNRTAER